jgi:hypothetical protein
MAKTAPRTILLRGRGIRKELPAGGTITPGNFIDVNSSGNAIRIGVTATPGSPRAIAVENDVPTTAWTGSSPSIDTDYVSGDLVQIEWLVPGMEVNATVAAAAPAIVIGDKLELVNGGTVRKAAATPTVPVAMALEALDNSGGGSAARLRVVIV